MVAERVAEHTALLGEEIKDSIRAGLAQTQNALRVTAARAEPVRVNAVNATSGRLVGWSLASTTGGTVTLYRSRDAADPSLILAVLVIDPGKDRTQLPAVPGVFFGEGLYVAGPADLSGALFFGAID